MGDNYIKVNSVAEFVEKITEAAETEDILNVLKLFDRKEHSLFFRGQSKKYTKEVLESAVPSIFREEDYINEEHNIFKEFILRNPDDFKEDKSTFEKLVRMQHYGLPTRLLDITSNALMALYIACSRHIPDCPSECMEDSSGKCCYTKTDNCKYDGYVIIFKIQKDKIKYHDSDTVSVLSNIARRPPKQDGDKGLDFRCYDSYLENCSNKDEYISIKDEDIRNVKIFNDYKAIQYLLHEIKEEKPYFKECILKDHIHDIVCVKPLLNNRRIIRQDGAFLLFGMKNEKKECPKINDVKDGIDTEVIRINGRNKQAILRQLANLGITEDKVYPEMDNVAKYLKKEYHKVNV